MLVDRARHPAIPYLEECFPVIHGEWDRVPPERLMAMPYPGLFTGEWHTFVIYHDPEHAEHHEMGRRNALLVPETRRLVEQIPGLFMAAWLRLGPESCIHRHVDELPVIRLHLSMTAGAGPWLKIEDETVTYEPGRCIGFDPNEQHESSNPGPEYRDLFVLDVLATRAQEGF